MQQKESGKRTLFVVLPHQPSHPYLGVVRLGDDASVRCPEVLRFENDFLKEGRHSFQCQVTSVQFLMRGGIITDG